MNIRFIRFIRIDEPPKTLQLGARGNPCDFGHERTAKILQILEGLAQRCTQAWPFALCVPPLILSIFNPLDRFVSTHLNGESLHAGHLIMPFINIHQRLQQLFSGLFLLRYADTTQFDPVRSIMFDGTKSSHRNQKYCKANACLGETQNPTNMFGATLWTLDSYRLIFYIMYV